MNIQTHKHFDKAYVKLQAKQQATFRRRRDIFIKNPNDPRLRMHKLLGQYTGCFSINITGDVRVIFVKLDPKNVMFVAIGTHNQLYS